MDLEEATPIDPISGNEVPPGATAAEVRDDVPINASEGEFIIPADVVRYLGLEKLEGMINKAKESISALSEGGRIGGAPPKEPMPAPTAPDPNMAPPPGMPMGMAKGGTVRRGMAEGGVVAPKGSATSVVPYINAQGRMIFIPFVNGQPVTTIPSGFSRADNGAPAAVTPSTGNSGKSEGRSNPPSNQPKSTYSQGPQMWTANDMITYGNQLNSGVQGAVDSFINRIPIFGNMLTEGRNEEINSTLPARLDQMLESGVDTSGTPLTPEQIAGLNQTKEVMVNTVAEQTNTPPNPFDSILGFIGNALGITQAPSSSTSTTKDIGGGKTATTTSVPSKVGSEGRTSTPNPTPNSFTPSSGTPTTSKPAGYTPVGSGDKDKTPQYNSGGLISPKDGTMLPSYRAGGFVKRK